MADSWEGEERRGIPIHILNYINESHTAVQNHTDERFNTLSLQINNISQSIDSWMEKEPGALLTSCESMMDEAFPSESDDPYATPRDRRKGHRTAHAQWMANVDAEMKSWRDLRQAVIKWAALGALGLICMALWQFLLKGP